MPFLEPPRANLQHVSVTSSHLLDLHTAQQQAWLSVGGRAAAKPHGLAEMTTLYLLG